MLRIRVGYCCALLGLVFSTQLYGFDWCGNIKYEPGALSSVFMVVNGRVRHYSLYVPKNYQATTPLLLDFHGKGSNKYRQHNLSCWKQAADKHGFAVVYPQAIGLIPVWNGGEFCCNPFNHNDDKFVMKIVQCLSDSSRSGLRIDAKNIYTVGLSNGAAIAGKMACDHPDTFSGTLLASQSFAYGYGEQCRFPHSNKTPFPVLEVRGLYDVIVPHDFSWGWSLPAAESRYNWKTAQGCTGNPRVVDICDRPGSGADCEYGKAICRVYDDCDGGVTVTQCSIREGHVNYNNGHHYNMCEDAWHEFQRLRY